MRVVHDSHAYTTAISTEPIKPNASSLRLVGIGWGSVTLAIKECEHSATAYGAFGVCVSGCSLALLSEGVVMSGKPAMQRTPLKSSAAVRTATSLSGDRARRSW